MIREDIQAGVIIFYPYLWSREDARGETAGRKDRPVVVAIRLWGERDRLILLPITTKMPTADQFAVELPRREKARAGLDVEMRLWLVLDECNQDWVGGSHYLYSDLPIGSLSKAFLLPVLRQLTRRWRETRVVDRN